MYLIDGHNLIGAGLIPDISLDQENAEERLVAFVRARQPNLKHTVTIVFDGGIPGGFAAALSGGGVSVTFAPQGRGDADALILGRVRAHKTPSAIVVVTNDGDLRRQAEGLGAQVWGAAAFLERLARPRRRPASTRSPRPQPEPKRPKQEVEEWLREFGVISGAKRTK